jgi:16S rRNA (cytosine967-C5)-methyltransferase
MKIHRPLVNAVTQALQKIVEEGAYADKVVEQLLKQNPKWGSRDRKFIAGTIYEMVRWWRLISECCRASTGTESPSYIHLFATWQILKGNDLPDWEEFSEIDKEQVLKNAGQIKLIRKYRESIPDWLDDIASKELGEEVWEKEAHELNKEAQVVLRVNTLKTSPEELQKKLLAQGVEVENLSNAFPLWKEMKKGALVLLKRQNLEKLIEYQQGWFEVQDASSQLIAPFLKVKEGMTVIDACAGAGGKSLHIAAMMNNKGKIIAMDVENKKLMELKRRADRAGVSIVKTRLVNSDAIGELKNSADRLLLDVPCSGLGVLRRNPDAKWKLSLEFIEQIKKTQQEIISTYSQMLKPGGIMVYATCSILPSENQYQVQEFLNKNANDFKLLDEVKVLPSMGFDGFYMAALEKKA